MASISTPTPRRRRPSARRSGAGSASTRADRVIGFTGTFGGWHGIDVLSEAIPRICREAPDAKFLLIGDGNFKHLVDRAVASSGCASGGAVDRPRAAGRGRAPAQGVRHLRLAAQHAT